jgi:hypothetical protein
VIDKTIKDAMNELTLPQRAAVALGTAEHEKQLILLVEESKTITAIKNVDARTQCHGAYMRLKNARVTIEKIGKTAREDAQAFSKAVISEEKRLIAITEAEEARLQALRDKWDADREAERQAERQRVANIQKMIGSLRDYPRMILASDPAVLSTALQAAIDEFDGWTPHVDDYAEFVPEAAAVIAESLAAMRAMLTQALAKEAAEAQAKADREAEAARLKAEREELARLRSEDAARKAEDERKAAEERAEQQALIAKQQAEFEARRKAEIAALEESRRQAEREAAEQRDKQEAELASQRAEMARQQAERDAEAARQVRAAKEAQAAAQAKLDAERAELDRQRAEIEADKRRQEEVEAARIAEIARAEETEAERIRLQAAADQALADARKPEPVVLPFLQPKPVRPTDVVIINVLALYYRVHESEVIEWLLDMDLQAASKDMAEAI